MTGQIVFIVDDDADLRDALAMLMRASGLTAETFASAKDLLQRIGQRDAGCLVLDIRMPGMSGIELQAELHKRRIGLPIIFLTGHADVPLAVKAMKAGAFDFIQKPLDEHRLVMGVMNALRHNIQENKLSEVAVPESSTNARLGTLSSREQEVLRWMLDGKQNREIADSMCISIKTVEFHRANIREKLGVSTLPELFKLVLNR
jgi:FixJ family two-component response regulator